MKRTRCEESYQCFCRKGRKYMREEGSTMKKVYLIMLILCMVFTTGCLKEGESTAILYAVNFAEGAIGYDVDYDHGDLRVFEIDTPPVEDNYYKVHGTIKRKTDGKHYSMQAHVERIEESGNWKLQYLKIDGRLIRDSR